ncbi:hypothetical protein [Luteolibacter soli]|uniref:DUF904 domain-containing protein n=1 Tax=Luteolibacter soli TaxID=3135280 RepID=A0ABU9APQ2_9BACT
MASTLSTRLAELEQKVAALSDKVEQSKDWRTAVGKLRDTKLNREADEVARQIRASGEEP